MGALDAADLEFVEKFDHCGLSKECWGHVAHIRMAWIAIIRATSYPEAVAYIRQGIQRLNSSLGSVGYHETVTSAFSLLIYERILKSDPAQTWEQFFAANEDLASRTVPILSRYYSPGVLASPESKTDFIEPDLKPLPIAGRLRLANFSDAAPMLAIYAPYVTDSAVSFEVEVPSEAEFAQRIGEVLAYAPWLVYECDGQVIGYAYASKHRAREAYKWTVEASAYVHPRYHRRGVAGVLYCRLFLLLRQQGFQTALAGITLPNQPSVGFHESMGFRPVGIYRNVGFKHEKWHDVGWWELPLGSYAHPSELAKPAKTGPGAAGTPATDLRL